MRTYEIPRNYKGESRILYIFSTKALIYTIVGMGIGLYTRVGLGSGWIFYVIFNAGGMHCAGSIVDVILRCDWFYNRNF